MKDSRQSIIDATERLLQSQGLARLTTREIAREADVAEGLIYHHFGNKANLIFKVVERRMLPTNNAVKSLPLQVGLRTVRKNLEDMLMVVYCNHYETAPIASSMLQISNCVNNCERS
jgi:AcrR family transcriptional regulator